MNSVLEVFEAILFDMDGVIIDTKEPVEAFWNEKMELYDVTIDDNYLESKIHGRPARSIIDDLFPHLSKKERDDLDDECALYDSSAEEYKIMPGVEPLLLTLQKSAVPFGLVTSALPPKVSVMQESLSIANPFLTVVTADLISNGKPDPECYLLGAKKLGIDIEKILVFEDSVSGVTSAHRAGATVIGVNSPGIAPMLADAGAKVVIEDFTGARWDANTNVLGFSNLSYQAKIIPSKTV